MRWGQAQKIGLTTECRTLGVEGALDGFCASYSDSIETDFRAPSIPNPVGQRPTKRAGLTGTIIPCLQAAYNKQYFSFWNQPVAVQCKKCLRQLKIFFVRPEKGGIEMATSGHFCASLLYGVFSDLLQTQNATAMANPEV
jgi:hypothetical protein